MLLTLYKSYLKLEEKDNYSNNNKLIYSHSLSSRKLFKSRSHYIVQSNPILHQHLTAKGCLFVRLPANGMYTSLTYCTLLLVCASTWIPCFIMEVPHNHALRQANGVWITMHCPSVLQTIQPCWREINTVLEIMSFYEIMAEHVFSLPCFRNTN